MKVEQSELRTSLEEKSNNSNYSHNYVEGTPFGIITNEDGKCKIVIGNNLATSKEYNDEKSALKEINKLNWELVINVAYKIAKNMMEENNNG